MKCSMELALEVSLMVKEMKITGDMFSGIRTLGCIRTFCCFIQRWPVIYLNTGFRHWQEQCRMLNSKDTKVPSFPWESAVTGCEVCPEKIYGDQEIHINGDVMMAFKQYYEITKDLDFFVSSGGWDVVSSIADYWCSRVVWSKE
ncbi:unnamed protein product, partial [Staurois parvus]